ncbi:MAG TPA: lactate racemase domain-containing protein [Acidimicrobiales bacterium]|jgi:nickel-dependent lactate racemase|nr:lactate racemase domain-containing protein [Acidimicrobiales bacterium]
MTDTVSTHVDTTSTIRLGAWYDDRAVQLEFPSSWRVIHCPPRDAADIGDDGIRAAFDQPIGTPRLRELAAGKRRPCIVIDDLSRPTQGRRLVPAVLDELQHAGIDAKDVLLLGGTANHRQMTRRDWDLKVGLDVLERCNVSQHFSWDNCVPLGTTSFGSPVEVNAEFMASDLKILVGSIIPHGAAGFSGGSKLLMPGVTSVDSAEAYHRGVGMRGRYAVVETDARLESDEAARMAGVDFLVNSVPNSTLGIGGLVTGDVVHAHRAGVQIARRIFASPTPTGCDVAVLSLYPKDTEFTQHLTAFAPWATAPERIVREGGTIVVALDGSEGFGFHSLMGPGRRIENRRPTQIKGRSLVFFSPHVDRGCMIPEVRESVELYRTWEATRAALEAEHGDGAVVAVYPCATMQLAEAVCDDRA